MAYVDLNTIHNPATGTAPPATWGDQVRDNFETLNARGKIARATTSGTDQTGITAEADVTGATVTVTTPASRLIRITGIILMNGVTNAGTRRLLINKDGSTLSGGIGLWYIALAGAFHYAVVIGYDTPTNASHTYKLRATSDVSSLTISNATMPGSIVVEDIGPA